MTKFKKILVVEDEEIYFIKIAQVLNSHFLIKRAKSVEQAKALLSEEPFDAVLLDKFLNGDSSFSQIQNIKQISPQSMIIVFTTDDSLESAAESISRGADDYVVKDLETLNSLSVRLKMTLEKQASMKASVQSRKNEFQNILDTLFVGTSKPLLELKFEIAKLKGTNAYVFIEGESGTGKELIARAIHAIENDPARPLVSVNCSAIPESLFESEIFGHVKGSFTGAITDKKGLFALANGGDLFLDEIADLSLANQTKLLRALETGEFRPVGSNITQFSSVRIISATNKNMKELIEKGQFREDLYYRLNVITLKTTPLRERKEDIESLSKYFIQKFSNATMTLSKQAISALQKEEYKGNIRELKNTIEKAYINARADRASEVELKHILFLVKKDETIAEVKTELTLQENIDRVEKEYLQKLLRISGISSDEIQKKTGVSRATFYNLLTKHNLVFKKQKYKKSGAISYEQH